MAGYKESGGIKSPKSISSAYAAGNGKPPAKTAILMDTTKQSAKNPPLPNLKKSK